MSTAAATAEVNTRKVAGRRVLRFASLDDAWADVNRIAAAERAGKLRRVGNWTPGQVFGHLAAWVHFGFDGNPLTPPWFVKLLVKPRKNRYLNEGLPAGVRIPRVEGGTVATEVLPLDEGKARLRQAWDRLQAGPPARPNVLFGPLTHEEWIKLNLRHAELHQSFLVPE